MGKGWDKDPNYGTPEPPVWWWVVSAVIVVLMIAAFAGISGAAQETVAKLEAGITVKSIYWKDGDSGVIDKVEFRLANVDAPETGRVGSKTGAKCEGERALGFEAKAAMVALTSKAKIEVTEVVGTDRHGRSVVRLSANGEDVIARGLADGMLKPWPHKGQKALKKKPDWSEACK
jgi:endonuclease YncB( thermonuclease family)